MSTQSLTITETEINSVQSKVEALTITDPASLATASEYRSIAKKYLKTLTDEKEKVTKPLNEALKAERSRFKPHEEALEAFIEVLDKKMSRYQTDLVASQHKAESAISARIGEGKGHLSLETAVDRLAALPTVEKKVETNNGATTFIATPVFEVIDLALLPIHLHLPDLVAIRKDMLAGIEHPGVQYTVEQRPRNSRN